MASLLTSFVDPKYCFITTVSHKTLFYPWWIWGSAFVINSQSKKEEIYTLMKTFMIFFWIIFISIPFILVYLINLTYDSHINAVQNSYFIIATRILFILYAFSPGFWLNWKIKKPTKGLQKLSRLKAWKGLSEYHNLSSLILSLLFISFFITLPLSWIMLTINQSFLATLMEIIPVAIAKTELISLTFLMIIGLIIGNIALLNSIIGTISLGYMTFIKLQNKYRKEKA